MSSPIWELKVIATKVPCLQLAAWQAKLTDSQSQHFAQQVPLNKRRFQGIVEEQDEFTPAQLLEMLAEQNMQVGGQECCCFLCPGAC